MQKQLEYISHRDALQMLDMNRNLFAKVIAPNVSTAAIGKKKFYKIDDLNKLLREREILSIKK